MAAFEFAILREDVRTKMENLHWWELPEDSDFTLDTLYDKYYSHFALLNIGKYLNISIDDWLKRPRYQCDRDIKLLIRVNERKSQSMDDELSDQLDID